MSNDLVVTSTAVSKSSYYEVLGLQTSSDAASVRLRYRALALENHPDRFELPDQKAAASTKFKLIREAYEVLADGDQRRRYDACLASGKPFVPQRDVRAGSEPSLADIFEDVDRFPFPAEAKQIPDAQLRELINGSIIKSETLKEKVVAVYGVVSSDIDSSTSAQVRGENAAAQYFVLTNFRILVAVRGSSSYEPFLGNARHSMSYWGGISVALMELDRLDLTVSAASSDNFDVSLYGPETPFSGTTFTLKGSVAPFLWLASLFAIPIGVSVKVPVDPESYRRVAWTSILLSFATMAFFVFANGAELWVRAGIAPMLLLAPIVGLAVKSYVRNERTRALARLFASYGG
jgi:curved DNA-binding protein CbpA